MVGKIHAKILVDRVLKVNERLIDDELGSFRSGRGCVGQIFPLKQIDEKTREKKCRVYVDFLYLKKTYDKFNMDVLWEVLRTYDVEVNF